MTNPHRGDDYIDAEATEVDDATLRDAPRITITSPSPGNTGGLPPTRTMPRQPPPPGPPPRAQPKQPAKWGTAVAVGGIVFAVALVVFVTWFFWPKDNTPAPQQPQYTEFFENLMYGKGDHNLIHLNDMLGDLEQTNDPIVAIYNDWDEAEQGLQVEARAMLHTNQRIQTDQPVNILLGTQYALSASSYDQLKKGTFAKSVRNPDTLYSPVMYLEERGDAVAVVLVTVQQLTQEQTDAYLNEVNGGQEEYIETPDGLVYIDANNLRWTARQFGKCVRYPVHEQLSSLCAYKWTQYPYAGYHRWEQIILTANLQQDNGQWTIHHGDYRLRVAVGVPADNGNTATNRNQVDMIYQLIKANGNRWSDYDLSILPEFPLRN